MRVMTNRERTVEERDEIPPALGPPADPDRVFDPRAPRDVRVRARPDDANDRCRGVGRLHRDYRRSVRLVPAVLASRLGRDEPEAERLAAAAIADGFAQGFIEYRSRMFVNTAFGVRPPPPP